MISLMKSCSVILVINGSYLALNDLPDLAHILFGVLRHAALAGTAGTIPAASASGFLCGDSPDRTDMLQKFQLPPDIRICRMQFRSKLFDRAGIPALQ